MKKIYLKEDTIANVLNKRLLPQFLFKSVKAHETSLGDNSMFPSGGDYPFDYTLLKVRFGEVCDAIELRRFARMPLIDCLQFQRKCLT